MKEQNGFWVNGCNSLDDPVAISKTSFVFAYNTLNRGGIVRTRPGFGELCAAPSGTEVKSRYHPQGAEVFRPSGNVPHLVIALEGIIYVSPYPFTTFRALPGLKFQPHLPITFEKTVKTTQTNGDGSLTFLPRPYAVLMIQDGVTRAGFWDGSNSRHCDPSPIPSAHEAPVGLVHKWVGGRYWVGDGRRVRASNLGDPLKFTEEDITAEGGFFTLNSDITAMGVTPDLQVLIVCTDTDTTIFQAGIFDRSSWRDTRDFQKVLFPTIGCVGPRAIVNQFGLTWIYSHDGLIGWDNALSTYRSSRIRYRDSAMARSKANLCSDLSGVCLGVNENLLFISVPSGDRYNAHTWVLDETVLRNPDDQTEVSAFAGIWTGIRPVQWVSAVIHGRKRLFVLSRDYAPEARRRDYVVGIWEALMNQRADCLLDGSAKRIRCGFESRTMLVGDDYKQLQTIEAGIFLASGDIEFRFHYAGMRTDYKFLESRRVIASAGPFGSPAQEPLSNETVIRSFRGQQRLLRCEKIIESLGRSVQDDYNMNIDQGFSVYLEWYGDMALRFIRLMAESKPDITTTARKDDETTQRYVDTAGNEVELEAEEPPPVAIKGDSRFADTLPIRYPEPLYSAR